MAFLIQVDPKQMAELERALEGVRNGVPKAASRAVNKVAGHVYAEVIRRVADRTGLKTGRVRKAVRLRRASYRVLRALVRIWNKRMPLIWFAARQTAKGVTFRAPPGADWALDYKGSKRGRLLAEHAFIARMPSGHEGVFLRKGGPRLPILELFGPSPMAAFEGITGLAEALMAEASALLERELHVQLRVLLEQEAARGRVLETKAA